jgi:hypothetical protein
MKPSIVCTLFAVVFLLVGLAPSASGATCPNPNTVLHATYGWEGHALAAAGNTNSPRVGDFAP